MYVTTPCGSLVFSSHLHIWYFNIGHDIHGPRDFGVPLTFHLASPWGCSFESMSGRPSDGLAYNVLQTFMSHEDEMCTTLILWLSIEPRQVKMLNYTILMAGKIMKNYDSCSNLVILQMLAWWQSKLKWWTRSKWYLLNISSSALSLWAC